MLSKGDWSLSRVWAAVVVVGVGAILEPLLSRVAQVCCFPLIGCAAVLQPVGANGEGCAVHAAVPGPGPRDVQLAIKSIGHSAALAWYVLLGLCTDFIAIAGSVLISA